MAKYTDAGRTAALAAVTALIESGTSVTKACRPVGEDRGIAVDRLEGWRSQARPVVTGW